MKNFVIVLGILFVGINSISAQTTDPTKDWLLLNIDIQLETNDAINDLYNFKFEKANAKFNELKQRYPKHPMAYFLLGLSEYWRIVPNDHETKYDATFHSHLDSAIIMAEALYDQNNNNYEAAFFLSASHGFKGRVYAMRKEYITASNQGRKSLKYLNLDNKATDMSPEFMFGTALYNYFREKIYEEYFWLRPLIKLSSSTKGDKELGIKQLNEVALNAFYTRTEAQAYLIDIYVNYERTKDANGYTTSKQNLALPIVKYLHETYPDNAHFHKYYARICFNFDNYHSKCEALAVEFIRKYNEKLPGYEDEGMRSATYYLGDILTDQGQFDKARKLLESTVLLSIKLNRKSGYYIYALGNLVNICDDQKDYVNAEKYCKMIIKDGDNDSRNENDEIENAKLYLKKLKELKKKK
jgi:hypothetical protein